MPPAKTFNIYAQQSFVRSTPKRSPDVCDQRAAQTRAIKVWFSRNRLSMGGRGSLWCWISKTLNTNYLRLSKTATNLDFVQQSVRPPCWIFLISQQPLCLSQVDAVHKYRSRFEKIVPRSPRSLFTYWNFWNVNVSQCRLWQFPPLLDITFRSWNVRLITYLFSFTFRYEPVQSFFIFLLSWISLEMWVAVQIIQEKQKYRCTLPWLQ